MNQDFDKVQLYHLQEQNEFARVEGNVTTKIASRYTRTNKIFSRTNKTCFRLKLSYAKSLSKGKVVLQVKKKRFQIYFRLRRLKEFGSERLFLFHLRFENEFEIYIFEDMVRI